MLQYNVLSCIYVTGPNKKGKERAFFRCPPRVTPCEPRLPATRAISAGAPSPPRAAAASPVAAVLCSMSMWRPANQAAANGSIDKSKSNLTSCGAYIMRRATATRNLPRALQARLVVLWRPALTTCQMLNLPSHIIW